MLASNSDMPELLNAETPLKIPSHLSNQPTHYSCLEGATYQGLIPFS
jgi:hypothetical protein